MATKTPEEKAAQAKAEAREKAANWKPEKGEACAYCYTVGNARHAKRAKAKVLKVHPDGRVDLEVALPEAGGKPRTFERVPLLDETPSPIAKPPSYTAP